MIKLLVPSVLLFTTLVLPGVSEAQQCGDLFDPYLRVVAPAHPTQMAIQLKAYALKMERNLLWGETLKKGYSTVRFDFTFSESHAPVSVELTPATYNGEFLGYYWLTTTDYKVPVSGFDLNADQIKKRIENLARTQYFHSGH